MATMTLVQAVRDAMALEMARDPRVVVLGEDVGKNGGVFRATEGLTRENECTRNWAIVGALVSLSIVTSIPNSIP